MPQGLWQSVHFFRGMANVPENCIAMCQTRRKDLEACLDKKNNIFYCGPGRGDMLGGSGELVFLRPSELVFYARFEVALSFLLPICSGGCFRFFGF